MDVTKDVTHDVIQGGVIQDIWYCYIGGYVVVLYRRVCGRVTRTRTR